MLENRWARLDPSHEGRGIAAASGRPRELRYVVGRCALMRLLLKSATALGRPVVGAILSAILFALACPPVGLWPLHFVSLAPWIWVLRGAGGGARIASGLAYGTAANVVVLSWVYEASAELLALSATQAAFACIGLALLQSGAAIAFALAYEPLRRRSGRAWPLVGTTLFVCAEWVIPRMVPWHHGTPLFAVPHLSQIADITGVHGLTGMSVLSALVIASAISRRRLTGSLGFTIVMIATVAAYGEWRIHQIDRMPVSDELRVGLIHMHLARNDESRVEDTPWRRQQAALSAAIDASEPIYRSADLIVWPESVLGVPIDTRASETPPTDSTERRLWTYSARIRQYARSIPGHLLVGATRQPRLEEPRRNSLVHYDRSGAVAGIYDKRVLFVWAEAAPEIAGVPVAPSLTPPGSEVSRGEAPASFEVDRITISPSICLEGIYPGEVRRAALSGKPAQLLINASRDRALAYRGQPALHFVAQRGRAIENRLPLLRATNGGITAHVDAAGRVVQSTDARRTRAVMATVSIREIYSFYREYGDVFVLFLAAAGALALAFAPGRDKVGRRNPEQ